MTLNMVVMIMRLRIHVDHWLQEHCFPCMLFKTIYFGISSPIFGLIFSKTLQTFRLANRVFHVSRPGSPPRPIVTLEVSTICVRECGGEADGISGGCSCHNKYSGKAISDQGFQKSWQKNWPISTVGHWSMSWWDSDLLILTS